MIVIRSTPKPIYYPIIIDNPSTKSSVTEPVNEKEKMFEKYFPKIKENIEMDYPLKPIGCCPPSKEMSKNLPIANIPICYAANSKNYL